jgi:hypothetical protein
MKGTIGRASGHAAQREAGRRKRGVDWFVGVGAFGLFAFLWLAFGIALIASQGTLDATWEWVRSLPWLLQAVLGIALLPVAAGLWIWETSWPLAVRLVLVGGIAIANLYTFFPRSLFGGQG